MSGSEFPPDDDPQGAKDRNFVTALARGLDVLRCYRRGEVLLSNTDFADRTGLPKATVSRLTHTLCQLDYLVLETATGSYRLGAGVLQLGFGVLASIDICDRAGSVLRDLRNGPNSYITAALGEAFRDEAIYLGVYRSRENVSLSMHVGSRLPLFFSAMGRAILVGSTDEQRQTAFESADLVDPENKQLRQQAYEAARSEFDTHGYCSSYGEWRHDVNAIAVPVHSLTGSRVFGLNVGGPSFHVKPKELQGYYAGALREAAGLLSLRP
ncbi:IclR family transcriptional regulator [Aliisedimentitalea scapharcae]|uniref:IclR family transcriptional regulator n=1 Tax=Aliisedimentitalea scapharcae TaxID=1524259 RepID=A0ABZ2XMF2_9RHOB